MDNPIKAIIEIAKELNNAKLLTATVDLQNAFAKLKNEITELKEENLKLKKNISDEDDEGSIIGGFVDL